METGLDLLSRYALRRDEDAFGTLVSRALEQLRGFLESRGVTSTASAIGTALSGHAVTVAPQGVSLLLNSVGHAALVSAVPVGSSAWLLVSPLKAQLVGVALLVASGGSWIWLQGREIGRLRADLVRMVAERDQAVADSAASSTALTAAATLQETERAELLRLRGALAGMRRAASTENIASSRRPAPAVSVRLEPGAFDADAAVTRVYVDAKSMRQSEPVQIPAERIDVTKRPAELEDAGTQSSVAAAESVLWATLHDAGAFSSLVSDRSSMLGAGDKLGATEKIRASLYSKLRNCLEVRFVVRTQEGEPMPGETTSVALVQADRADTVVLSLTFVPTGDHWMLEQAGVASGR